MYEFLDKWSHQKWQGTFDKSNWFRDISFFLFQKAVHQSPNWRFRLVLSLWEMHSYSTHTLTRRNMSTLALLTLHTHTNGLAHTNRFHPCPTMIHKSALIISRLLFVPFNQWSWFVEFLCIHHLYEWGEGIV